MVLWSSTELKSPATTVGIVWILLRESFAFFQQVPVVGHRLDTIEHEIEENRIRGVAQCERQCVVNLGTELEGLLRRSPSATV